jgi:hydroxypyruvate reductase
LALARAVPADERCLVLLSGGASSLMAAPAPGITLEEKRRATATLLRAGADIHAFNTVRKHISAIKGGRLGTSLAAPCRTLTVSDVVGDDLSVIGSGPTVADASTFADAHAVLQQFAGLAAYPASVVAQIEAGVGGNRDETPKPGDPRLARSIGSVVGGRFDAMRGAEAEARARRYRVLMIERPVVGEARVVGPRHVADVLARIAGMPRPLCVVSSGETTVTVRGPGRGGRNQELALAAAETLAGSNQTIALASFGTDGVDGPTDAAGAIADSTTLARAHAANLLPEVYLDTNDSFTFFAAIGDLIQTGPTGTNVGDLQVLLVL